MECLLTCNAKPEDVRSIRFDNLDPVVVNITNSQVVLVSDAHTDRSTVHPWLVTLEERSGDNIF